MNDRITRRFFLSASMALPLTVALPLDASAQAAATCSTAKSTRPETGGPNFKPRSPERQSLLEPGIEGRRLILTGSVMTTGCRPIARALLDFWHANPAGQYDNTGFRLRGHQYANSEGSYQLETIVPGPYAGRTRHIHVKVQAPGGTVLTSQLYFPGEPANVRDGLFARELLMTMIDSTDPLQMQFDFVVVA